MKNYLRLLALCCGLLFISCNDDDDTSTPPIGDLIELESRSTSPVLLKKMSGFTDIEIYNLLSSEDTYIPNFTYGSMADGAGLLRNADGTYTLINNIEADYAIARITLDETFKPIKGEHILNAVATAETAQCSGSMISPEEHGFGPMYLSGGEWGGNSKGVFATDPYRDPSVASTPRMLTAMGQWSTENAVAIGKDAYSDKTVVFIGDDNSNNEIPSGQLGMYVGNRGDLEGGKLYGLKVTSPGITYEMDMEEGTAYDMEFVELTEKDIDLLDTEAKSKGVMGFSRLEDIDWRRGSATNNREVYLAVTGRDKPDLIGKGTRSGRVYKVVLNENDPTGAGKITCVLDGDKEGGKAEAFHSPDNILVTENYAYIQEDPNGIQDFKPAAAHYARLYQYDLNSGALKAVLECDQVAAAAQGYGPADRTWEITGMIDISDIIGVDETFILITQNHGWEKTDGTPFTDPNANPNVADSRKEGSMMYIVKGLGR
ncbi:phosphatase [Aquimarina sp. BL5]|uniref:alkaline phosphatase PhoX n=1 Tax=Aquimarina sp. BL5 TaxID=1714860 RepID=UPI000E4D5ED2|nr:alkaline phosphatase PhoX [Aquimarina sp. BL5]AXT49973.1 phosphatase [Aquimarina sp. BL5]RKM96255.1 phosphatase [Aquimarina sp. BL5]